MNSKKILFILILTAITSGCSTKNEVKDFDMVCNYFGELELALNTKEMNGEQRNDFIMERVVANLPESSSARVAWQAISHADSEERYGLFKYAADSIQDTDWQCKPMKSLAPSTDSGE